MSQLKTYIQSIFGGSTQMSQSQAQGGSGGAGVPVSSSQYCGSSNTWVSQGSLSSGRHLLGSIAGLPQHGTGKLLSVPDITNLPTTCVDYAAYLGSTWHQSHMPVGAGSLYYDTATGDSYIIIPGSAGVTQLGLSVEEQEKLKSLEEDRKRATKQAKINYFKKLPQSMRQQVVDNIMWDSAVRAIDSEEAPKSQEQIDLESKNHRGGYSPSMGGLSYGGSLGGWGNIGVSSLSSQLEVEMYGGGRYRGILMPRDLTAEELVRAHAEATAEEVLLGTGTDSK